MNIVTGDLIQLALQGKFDTIVHGCNCHNTMGSGIAKQIRTTFPEAYAIDQATNRSDPAKLGTFSIYTTPYGLNIINAYTQYNFLPRGKCYDYDAIETAFRAIAKTHYEEHIAYPAIGCGLAGGDWNIVKEIINDALDGIQHTFVQYRG